MITRFLNEFKSEFDRNNFSFWQCSYDEELPTYGVLYKREVNGIPEELCPRCKKTNEIEVSDLIKESIYEYETKMIDEKKSEEAAIVRDINFDFIRTPCFGLGTLNETVRFQLGNFGTVRLGASKQNVEAFLSVWEIRMTTFETVQAGNFKQ
ncbi:hypothetical protein GLOIN_2v1771490 [Rhizophagus irregularis DAOM 181602=DAOM 197198]|uniref:Uncharacterized protein n=1 Tax=Rhizophagus irregularis (strain DAOM 181602 / DAOM 197198 / MUCL 43194) TaxID=747089 RepID=A0A2P4Q9L5_RHIID|nr:hypothetical protein GLOIN_2v1771490 [Rhizophagus irregularis DAOM 181602=DAOM 197198]POG74278.1 hypothetical protein GLOIN_2v1771490 [Rhizophagus irregularis DAOM 181602=DAOM 197198]|eukprot:XP_025181144.1 hypothetical protein GLOIN_2v1771490 [Rhizophagus irregularis DAOM 181602=DAOM 197198]